MSLELQPMESTVLLSLVSVCIMWPVHCTVIGGISGHVIRMYILYIYVLVYFWHSFISISQDRIDVFYVLFNAWDSQVSVYTPFHFSFTVPLRRCFQVREVGVSMHYTAEWKPMDKHTVYVLWKKINFEFT